MAETGQIGRVSRDQLGQHPNEQQMRKTEARQASQLIIHSTGSMRLQAPDSHSSAPGSHLSPGKPHFASLFYFLYLVKTQRLVSITWKLKILSVWAGQGDSRPKWLSVGAGRCLWSQGNIRELGTSPMGEKLPLRVCSSGPKAPPAGRAAGSSCPAPRTSRRCQVGPRAQQTKGWCP